MPGSLEWIRLALMVGEGKGTLQVRSWAKAQGVDPDALALPPDQPPSIAWADALEQAVLAGQASWDEYAARLVWTEPGALRVAVYASATIKAVVGGVDVTVELISEGPGHPEVEVRLYPAEPIEFSLFLRLPGWSSGCLVTGEGASRGEAEDREGWFELRQLWKRDDGFTLRFDRAPEAL